MEHPLRQFRRSNELTLDALAERTGLSKSFLSEIETGKRDGSRNTIRTICEKTGLLPSQFFDWVSPTGGPLGHSDADIGASSLVAEKEETTNEASNVVSAGTETVHAHR